MIYVYFAEVDKERGHVINNPAGLDITKTSGYIICRLPLAEQALHFEPFLELPARPATNQLVTW